MQLIESKEEKEIEEELGDLIEARLEILKAKTDFFRKKELKQFTSFGE